GDDDRRAIARRDILARLYEGGEQIGAGEPTRHAVQVRPQRLRPRVTGRTARLRVDNPAALDVAALPVDPCEPAVPRRDVHAVGVAQLLGKVRIRLPEPRHPGLAVGAGLRLSSQSL